VIPPKDAAHFRRKCTHVLECVRFALLEVARIVWLAGRGNDVDAAIVRGGVVTGTQRVIASGPPLSLTVRMVWSRCGPHPLA
jgi:hypothetical protein